MNGEGRSAVIVEAMRTPIGKYGGALKDVRVDDMSALVMKAVVDRSGIDPAQIGDVIWGCANQAGEDNRNLARMSLLLAGFPQTVPGTTVNRLCGSSLDAVVHAARSLMLGDNDIILAGGAESMSRAPYVLPKNVSGSALYGNLTAFDTALGWRFPNPRMRQMFPLESMGETADNVAERYSVSRADQDAFALESHRRAVRARAVFTEEILPVEIPAQGRSSGPPAIVAIDEGPRENTSLEQLARLAPAFRPNGSVTAGNSSSLNDGAAALLLMAEEKALALRMTPIARLVSWGVAGIDPRMMGMGPVPAVRMAVSRSQVKIEEIGLVELNEAFAAQSLAVIRELNLKAENVNVNGGAIALGHPLGCSGARILTTLVHELRRRDTRYGLATMCIGVGQGIAVLVERMS